VAVESFQIVINFWEGKLYLVDIGTTFPDVMTK